MEVVITSRGRGLRLEPAHGAHIGGELPDLIVRYLAAERRHPVWAAFANGLDDVLQRTAVDPAIIHEGRPEIAAAVGVAAIAVEPRVKALALTDMVGVAFEFLGLARDLLPGRAGAR